MELVVFCGIPSSGKSTFREKFFDTTHQVVSKDRMGRKSKKQDRQDKLIAQHFLNKHDIVVDNNNVELVQRRHLSALARSSGAIPKLYYFVEDLASCIRRNAQRVGKKRVPDFVIRRFSFCMEVPTLDEDFDEFFLVSISDVPGEFIVQRIK